MLSARSIVTLTIVVALLAILGIFISLLQTPDGGGRVANSYGTRGYGYRALYEVLTELDVPVTRRLAPPSADLGRDATLVFWAPNPSIVQLEPAYLHAVAQWVRDGGRVVVTPPLAKRLRGNPLAGDDGGEPRDMLAELGLSGVAVLNADQIVASEAEAAGTDPLQDRKSVFDEGQADGDDFDEFRESVLRALDRNKIPTRLAEVTATGTLASLPSAVSTIEVDVKSLRVIDLGDSQPTGTLTISRDGDKAGVEAGDEAGVEAGDGENPDLTMVAVYRQGQGEIVVVGDPGLLQNRSIANADNSVLGVYLVSPAGGPVVFDEFYHGLTIRGNPFWLLTRSGYAMAAVCILLVIGLWVWRQSLFLGPPLAPEKVKRRSIMEYVEAMSRFLIRGRASYPYLLHEVRDGVLHAVRHELGLPPGSETPEQISAALARRDPRRAERFVAAVAAVDQAIADPRHLGEKQTVQAMQRISACL